MSDTALERYGILMSYLDMKTQLIGIKQISIL